VLGERSTELGLTPFLIALASQMGEYSLRELKPNAAKREDHYVMDVPKTWIIYVPRKIATSPNPLRARSILVSSSLSFAENDRTTVSRNVKRRDAASHRQNLPASSGRALSRSYTQKPKRMPLPAQPRE